MEELGIKLTEVEIEPELRDLYEMINADIAEKVMAAVIDPISFYPSWHPSKSTKEILPLSVPLLNLNRDIRCERKLDKALRRRLSSEEFDGADGVLVFPYDQNLPQNNLHQSLVEIYPKGTNHCVSIQRVVIGLAGEDDKRLLHEVDYSLTIAPINDALFSKEDVASPTVQWVVHCMQQGDYDETARILRERCGHIQNRNLLGVLWQKLRLLEAGKSVEFEPAVVAHDADENASKNSHVHPTWLQEGNFNVSSNPVLAAALIAFAEEAGARQITHDEEKFRAMLYGDSIDSQV